MTLRTRAEIELTIKVKKKGRTPQRGWPSQTAFQTISATYHRIEFNHSFAGVVGDLDDFAFAAQTAPIVDGLEMVPQPVIARTILDMGHRGINMGDEKWHTSLTEKQCMMEAYLASKRWEESSSATVMWS